MIRRTGAGIALLFVLLLLQTGGSGAATPTPPRRWLLAVGVTGYTRVPRLHGCENDARLFSDVLVRSCGFDPACVRVLDPSRCDRRGIETAFRSWLIDPVGPNDEVVFYFSGHGTQVTLNGETHEGICPVDTDPSNPSTLILDRDLSAWIKQTPAARVVIVLDACNSGTNVKALVIGSSTKFVQMESGPPSPVTVAWGDFGKSIEGFGKTVLLAACQATETAADTKIVKDDGTAVHHGAFTWALTRVLQCLDPQSAVGVGYEDLLARTRHIVRYQLNELQTPVLRGSHGDRAVFSLSAVQPTALADRTLPGGARPALHRDDALPVAEGRPLLVSVRAFENDRAGVAKVLEQNLAALGIVKIAGPLEPADLIVSGCVSDRVHINVQSPAGRVIKAIDASTLQEALAEVAGEARCAYTFSWLARLQKPGAAFSVELHAERTDLESYRMGEEVRFRVRASKDCHLTLVDISTNGTVAVLFPNKFNPDARIKAGQEITVPDSSFRIVAGGSPGREMVVAVATLQDTPLAHLAELSQGAAFYQFANAQTFRKTLVSTLSSATKGLAPQAGPVSTAPIWAEAHAVINLRR